MGAFIDNFRKFIDAGKVNNQTRDEELKGVPDPNPVYNNYDWQQRVAVPFSYRSGPSNRRTFGVLYLPNSASDQISGLGKIKGEELKTYGAEVMDGSSLTPSGVQQLFEKHRSDFTIHPDMVSDEDSADNTRDPVHAGYSYNKFPGVLAADSDKLKRLKETVLKKQEKELSQPADTKYSYTAQNNFIQFLRGRGD